MKTTVSKVRNTKTGQIFEVIPGSLLPDFFEEVHVELPKGIESVPINVDIDKYTVGEPKVDFEIEETKPEPKVVKKVKKTTKKTKTTKKGAKKDDSKKTK